MPNRALYFYGTAALVVVVALLLVSRNVKGAAAGLGGAAVDAVDGFVSGAVVGAGSLFGLPDTNTTACAQAVKEGRIWDASFACPAKDFFKGVFSGSTSTSSAPAVISELPGAADFDPVDPDELSNYGN